MGLTEAVLAICEANVEHLAKDRWDVEDIDFESHEYYSWLVDESNKMADVIFEGIDNSIERYMDSGNMNPPPNKEK